MYQTISIAGPKRRKVATKLTLNGLIIALTAVGVLLRPSPADVQFSNVGRILDVARFAMVFGFVLVLLISAVLGLRRAAKGSADTFRVTNLLKCP